MKKQYLIAALAATVLLIPVFARTVFKFPEKSQATPPVSPSATIGIAVNRSPQKGATASLPYFNDFNEEEMALDGWTFVNTNPAFTWQWTQYSGHEGTPCLHMTQVPSEGEGTPSDNWVFTPAFDLQEGITYRLRFYITNWFPSDIEVLLTSGTDISESGTLLLHYEGDDWGDKEAIFETPSTGVYHIAFHDKSPYTENGTSLRYQVYIDNLSLMALSDNAVPEAVGSLRQIPGAGGEISMGLEWSNPILSKKGEELDVLTEIQVTKDGSLIETLRDNIAPGEKMRWTDPNPTAGVHTYKVVAFNSTGEGDEAKVSTFIGIDDPGIPENLVMDYDADGGIITLDWEEPAFGRRGGWFDRTGLSYRVVRQPGNKLLANNLTDPYFEDDNLDEYGNYIYEVTARTDAGLGGTATTSGVLTGSHATLPIIEGWENPYTYPTWEIVDNGGDGHTIGVRHAFGHESNSAIGWDYLQTEVEVDESLYSAPVRLEKGKKYRASFWVMSNPYASFSCDLSYGKAKTQTAQSNVLISYYDVSTGGDYVQSDIKEFSVDKTDTYYFSLWVHDCSHHLLWFDDLRIEEVLDKNIVASSVRNLENAPTIGDKITTGVTYSNRGTGKSSSFKVQLIDNDNNVLGEQEVKRPLAAGDGGTADIEWIVPNAAGRFALRGRVVMDGDECSADDTSAPYYIDIQEKGKRAITIGTATDLDRFPFGCYGYNFTETIYPGEEFGNLAGDMYAMAFKVQFGMEQDYTGVPFRIYLCNTEENDLFKGWIPANYQMTKVFDGTLDLMRGMTEVAIPFDIPFSYGGGNLCVLVEGLHDVTLMLNNGYGMNNYVTQSDLGVTRSWDRRGERPDAANPDQSVGKYYSCRPNATFYIDHSVSASIKGTITDTDGNPVAGAIVNGGIYNPLLMAETDDEGYYEIPYFPVGWGSASLEVNKKGYETGFLYGDLASGETSVIDYNEMKKCALVTVKGKITSSVDNSTPVAGAVITAIGDNTLYATTDAAGMFELKDAYVSKAYSVFTIEADGYKPISRPNNQFYDFSGTGITELNVNLAPVTAAPFSVAAFDRGDKAVITWEKPVENVTVTKASDEIVGKFGGAGLISVAHRYFPDELKSLGVGDDLLLKEIRFVPMCHARFTIAVWQGQPGHEAPVYLEDVIPENFQEWNNFVLSKPFEIDPEKSLLIGLKVDSSSGSYPIAFDYGPLEDGGDVILDATMNQWTTAHELLPGQMEYNWAIQGVFGNNPNSAAVPWLTNPEESPAKAVSLNNATPEDMAVLNGNVRDKERKVENARITESSVKLLDVPVHAAGIRGGLRHEIKGYNIYRIEPGQESSCTWFGQKVNEEPVTGTNFTDESWSSIEDKPYRYAVVSFYGNPDDWGDGVISDPTFSDGIDKGRYSSLTVNVTTDNGSAEGSSVYLIGDGKSVRKSVEDGKNSVTFEDVRFTDYEIKVVKPYFNIYTSHVAVDAKTASHDAILTFAAPVVPDMQVTDYINETCIAWSEPVPAMGMDIHTAVSKPGQELDGFNIGKETIVGYRVTPQVREGFDYTDFYFDEISFYANAATTYYPVVWRRNLEPQRPTSEQLYMEEEHEIYRQRYDVSPEEIGTWVTVKLDEPVKINSKDTYYVGFAATGTNELTPMVLDDSGTDPEGAWYYNYNPVDTRYNWMNLSMQGSWMVKAHITDTPDAGIISKEAVKYDLYRLMDTDMGNEKSWTKINSSPLEATSFTDVSWKGLAETSYRYAIKARYEGDATSAATFSKELRKGKVALVDIDITANNGMSSAGTKVTLVKDSDTYRGEAGADGKIEIPEVKKGKNYNLTIVLPGYEEISGKVDINQDMVSMIYELSEIKEAPVYLDAVASADNSAVDLTWRQPGEYAPAEGWVHWDNGQPYAGFGTSTGFCAVAQAFTPEDLETMRMKEYDITRISFFPTDNNSNPTSENSQWIAKIWRINMMTSEVEEIATGEASNVVLNQWNEVVFDTPYHVNGDETLLIGYEFYGSGNALGIDRGPCRMGRGDWANFGDGWITLSSAVSDFDYNNLIHVYVEDSGRRERENVVIQGTPQPILKNVKVDVNVSKVNPCHAVKADHPQLSSGANYPYKGFLVYRLNANDRENESSWTQLTPEPIKVTEFTDINWKNVAKGTYLWAVKAVYATGNSAPEFSLVALNDDGSVSAVEEVGSDGIRIERISGDRLRVEVPADAHVNIADVQGMTVLAATVCEGENILNVNLAEGVYLIRVVMEGTARMFKIML